MLHKREGYKTLNARGAFESACILVTKREVENVTNCRVTICRTAKNC
jgi:hypothetical protein